MYKTELIKPRRPWRNANHVEAETATYLDWFNNRRLYEYCGDMPPVKLEGVFYLDFRSYEATRWGLTCWFAFCSGVA